LALATYEKKRLEIMSTQIVLDDDGLEDEVIPEDGDEEGEINEDEEETDASPVAILEETEKV
jgi:hypothetical protein